VILLPFALGAAIGCTPAPGEAYYRCSTTESCRLTFRLLTTGAVQCYGNNEFGQLGRGATSPPDLMPATVSGLGSSLDVAVLYGSSCALS
jgi:hypothetical protein